MDDMFEVGERNRLCGGCERALCLDQCCNFHSRCQRFSRFFYMSVEWSLSRRTIQIKVILGRGI